MVWSKQINRQIRVFTITIAFPLLTGSPLLKIPDPTNTPSTPNYIIKAASAGVEIPPAAKFTTGNLYKGKKS